METRGRKKKPRGEWLFREEDGNKRKKKETMWRVVI